eukprot:TRINITY_DN23596_c0_g3_i1.p1 TRINITY_DN23596_c0_g3~~TRINITY_DN23596_c0_g3_i1.p1  ORF type:complete len:126 (+),score=21.19 TRINITY_DN23596_c0_g3_i1:40-417(+)
MAVVLRLARAAEIETSAANGQYAGVPGLDDGFIHLSTPTQARSTAKLYFKDCTDLVLLAFDVARLRDAGLDVRYEDAKPQPGIEKRDGDFPHCYGGPIPWSCLSEDPLPLPLSDSGEHIFPERFL